jgi:triosephosphate isomerase
MYIYQMKNQITNMVELVQKFVHIVLCCGRSKKDQSMNKSNEINEYQEKESENAYESGYHDFIHP